MANANQFPFAFDADKMRDMFKMPELDKMFEQMQVPNFDMDAMVKAQQKNFQALVEANQAAMSGYQEIYRRQTALVEKQMAKAKDQISELQSQPMSAEGSSKNLEDLKATLDQLSSDLQEMSEMAQKANTQALDIVRTRFEESLQEFKSAADKAAR